MAAHSLAHTQGPFRRLLTINNMSIQYHLEDDPEALGRHLVHILLLISIISIFGDLVYINNLPPNSYNMCQDMQSCPLITVKFTKRLSKFFQEEILAAIVVR